MNSLVNDCMFSLVEARRTQRNCRWGGLSVSQGSGPGEIWSVLYAITQASGEFTLHLGNIMSWDLITQQKNLPLAESIPWGWGHEKALLRDIRFRSNPCERIMAACWGRSWWDETKALISTASRDSLRYITVTFAYRDFTRLIEAAAHIQCVYKDA